MTITYRGGSTVPEAETLETAVSSGTLTADGSAWTWSGERLRIVWTSADGDTSTTLVRTRAPR